jgi:hypothetical protein
MVVLLSLAGCLDAPPEGGAVAAGPDAGPGSSSDPADGGALCPDGSGAAIAFPARFEAPTGVVGGYINGVALVINTGSLPLDLGGLSVQFFRASDDRVVAMGDVTIDDVVAPSGEAFGLLDTSIEGIVAGAVDEPWTNTVRPAVSLTFDYQLPADTIVTIDLVASIDDRVATLSIDLVADEGSGWSALSPGRVDMSCPD